MTVMGLGFLVALVMVEVGFRLFLNVTDIPYQFGDPIVGPRRLANQEGHIVLGNDVSIRYHFNAQGWNHLRDYAIPKPAGMRRVCLVGDSFVESLTVDIGHTMYDVAEKAMNRPDRPVEWLAFGNSGWGTTQEYEVIRHYTLDYKPDTVVLFFVQNDPWDSSPYMMPPELYITTYRLNAAHELELMPPTLYDPPSWRRLSSHSAVVRYFMIQRRIWDRFRFRQPAVAVQLRETTGDSRVFREPAAAAMTNEQRFQLTWELEEKTLAAMRDECNARGAKLMIAFCGCEPVILAARTGQPASRPARDVDPYCLGPRVQDMGPEWVEPIAKRLGIPYLDLTGPLSAAVAATGQPHIVPNDSHYNALGHETAGKAMAAWIDAEWAKSSPNN